MQNKKLKKTLRNIAEIAIDAHSNNESTEVYSWDAYESCKYILQEMQSYGYSVEEMLAEIAQEKSIA